VNEKIEISLPATGSGFQRKSKGKILNGMFLAESNQIPERSEKGINLEPDAISGFKGIPEIDFIDILPYVSDIKNANQ